MAFIEKRLPQVCRGTRETVERLLTDYQRTGSLAFLNEAKYRLIDAPTTPSCGYTPGYVFADAQYHGVNWGFTEREMPSVQFYRRRKTMAAG